MATVTVGGKTLSTLPVKGTYEITFILPKNVAWGTAGVASKSVQYVTLD